MHLETASKFNERKDALLKKSFTYNKNMGWPVVNTSLALSSAGKNAKMKGEFIIDFGNASLLFLMKQHKDVNRMIVNSGIDLQEARNPQGQVVAEGIFANEIIILNTEFCEASVGVTDKMKSIS